MPVLDYVMDQDFLVPLPFSHTLFEISRDLFCQCDSVNVGSMREVMFSLLSIRLSRGEGEGVSLQ